MSWENVVLPERTPWYQTQFGQTIISLAGIALMLVAYWVANNWVVSGIAGVLTSLFGVVGLVVMLVYSGRAATKAMGQLLGGGDGAE